MVTMVLAEEVREGEIEPDPEHVEVAQWRYQVPFPGVRYYSYEQATATEVDPRDFDVLMVRM